MILGWLGISGGTRTIQCNTAFRQLERAHGYTPTFRDKHMPLVSVITLTQPSPQESPSQMSFMDELLTLRTVSLCPGCMTKKNRESVVGLCPWDDSRTSLRDPRSSAPIPQPVSNALNATFLTPTTLPSIFPHTGCQNTVGCVVPRTHKNYAVDVDCPWHQAPKYTHQRKYKEEWTSGEWDANFDDDNIDLEVEDRG